MSRPFMPATIYWIKSCEHRCISSVGGLQRLPDYERGEGSHGDDAQLVASTDGEGETVAFDALRRVGLQDDVCRRVVGGLVHRVGAVEVLRGGGTHVAGDDPGDGSAQDKLLSAGGHAAVHDHASTHHGVGLIGGEVRGHRGDFFGRNQAAVGLSGLHLLAGVVGVFVAGGDARHPRCVDRAGGDAVDAHALFYVVYRRRPRKREDASLRGTVGRTIGNPNQGGDGGHVYYRPATGLLYGRYGVLHPEEGALQAHVQHQVPVFFYGLGRGGRYTHARVVYHDVEAVPLLDDAPHQRLDLLFLSNVGLVNQRVPFEFGGDLFCTLLIQVGDCDSRAFLGHAKRDGPSNSCTGAGDDCALV